MVVTVEKAIFGVASFIVFGSLFLIMLFIIADAWLDGIISEKVKRWLA